jgi:hypothetical protein
VSFPKNSLGAGLGDGADVFDDLLAAHADAVVADGDGLGILVHADLDLQFSILLEQGRVGQGLEAQLVRGIARVGNQFPEEDFLVAVEGMDHQVKQLLHLGLEAQGFLGRGFGHVEISPVENSDLNGDQRRRFKRVARERAPVPTGSRGSATPGPDGR